MTGNKNRSIYLRGVNLKKSRSFIYISVLIRLALFLEWLHSGSVTQCRVWVQCFVRASALFIIGVLYVYFDFIRMWCSWLQSVSIQMFQSFELLRAVFGKIVQIVLKLVFFCIGISFCRSKLMFPVQLFLTRFSCCAIQTGWIRSRSLSNCYLRIQSVPQREHHTSPLQGSTG
jgi:hypothetical protein